MRQAFAIVAFVIGSSFASQTRCEYLRKVVCSSDGFCEASPIVSAYLLVPPRLADLVGRQIVVQRCDAKGCSAVDVTPAISGAFVIASGAGSYYLKLVNTPTEWNPTRGAFVESSSLGLMTITYWGRCPAEF